MPGYLVASTLEAVLAQRLVRVICAHCRETGPPDEEPRRFLEADGSDLTAVSRGRGCEGALQGHGLPRPDGAYTSFS